MFLGQVGPISQSLDTKGTAFGYILTPAAPSYSLPSNQATGTYSTFPFTEEEWQYVLQSGGSCDSLYYLIGATVVGDPTTWRAYSTFPFTTDEWQSEYFIAVGSNDLSGKPIGVGTFVPLGPLETPIKSSYFSGLGYSYYYNTTIFATASNTISVTHSITLSRIFSQNISSTVTPTDSGADVDVRLETASSTISVTDSATDEHDIIRSVSDTINPSTAGSATRDQTFGLSDTVVITDVASNNPTQQVSNTISITDSVTFTMVRSFSVSDTVTPSQSETDPGSTYNQSLTSTVAPSQSFVLNISETDIFTDTITVTQSVVVGFVHSASVSDTITVTQSDTGVIDIHGAVHTVTPTQSVALNLNLHIGLTQTVTPTQSDRPNINAQSVADTIILLQDMTLNWVVVSVSDTIIITERLVTNPSPAGNTLTPTDSVTITGPIYVSASDTVNILDSVITAGANLTIPLVDTIVITDGVVRNGNTFTKSVSNTVVVNQTIAPSRLFVDNVNVVDVLLYEKGVYGVDTINIVDTVTTKLQQALSLSHSIALTHGIGYFLTQAIRSSCPPTKSWAPNGNLGAEPTLVHRSGVILTYPYTSPVWSLQLRSPEFNDLQKKSYRRIIRETRGGNLRIYRNSTWPKFDTLSYSINLLSEVDANKFLKFLSESLGQEVGLLDYESRQWRGIITTPDTNVEYSPHRVRSITFEFEGALA